MQINQLDAIYGIGEKTVEKIMSQTGYPEITPVSVIDWKELAKIDGIGDETLIKIYAAEGITINPAELRKVRGNQTPQTTAIIKPSNNGGKSDVSQLESIKEEIGDMFLKHKPLFEKMLMLENEPNKPMQGNDVAVWQSVNNMDEKAIIAGTPPKGDILITKYPHNGFAVYYCNLNTFLWDETYGFNDGYFNHLEKVFSCIEKLEKEVKRLGV